MLAFGRALWDRALVCLPAFRCLAVDGGMRYDCGLRGHLVSGNAHSPEDSVEKARLRMRILSLAVNVWWFLGGGGAFGAQHGGQSQYGGKGAGRGNSPTWK